MRLVEFAKSVRVRADAYLSFLAALGERAPAITYAGNAGQYIDSVINNLAEVDEILPDSLARPLIERIRLLLDRANREAELAVKLRQRAEAAEERIKELESQSLGRPPKSGSTQ